MKNRVRIFSFILLLFTTSLSFGQKNSPIKDADELEREKEVLVSTYPHIFTVDEINDVRVINDRHSIVYHTRNGVNYETVINSATKDMMLIATCQEISVNALPAVVSASLEKTEPVQKAFIVTTPDSAEFYRVDVRVEDDKATLIKSLFFDHMGNEMQAPY